MTIMLRSVFFAGGRRFGGRVTLNDIWRCGRRVRRPSREGRDEARKEGTKANRNSWCLNERGQLRLDIQSAEERERSRVGVDHRHSTDWMVEVGPSVEWRRRVVALEHAIRGDNDDDKKKMNVM